MTTFIRCDRCKGEANTGYATRSGNGMAHIVSERGSIITLYVAFEEQLKTAGSKYYVHLCRHCIFELLSKNHNPKLKG